MGTVYAIANQKGGVGKTTTAVNLAACVAEAGYDALLVDIDPQCNATIGLGISKDDPGTIYDVLIGSASIEEVVRPTGIEHLSLVPSGPDLAGANVELPRVAGLGDAAARGARPACATATPSPCSTARPRSGR